MKHILIVEDDINLSELIKFRLQQLNYQVESVSDGIAMFEQMRKQKPDLIILDVMLPKIDGYKLCTLIKNYEPYKEIPIIIFTARSGDEAKTLAKESGCDAYITKPFDNKRLLEKVKELLEKTKVQE
ncbi:MAG: response regulator [candidate division WOR-3 bacterium]